MADYVTLTGLDRAQGRGHRLREVVHVAYALGARMGMHIWIPRNNREAVLAEWKGDHAPLLDRLPLNYDDVTLRTIEQIDVLWLKGRAIKRAFEEYEEDAAE